MGMYEQFFEAEKAGLPYQGGEEALEEIQALVDMYLNMAFYNRDLSGQRLDMRGVVITPQEFQAALTDWTLNARKSVSRELLGYQKAVREEAFRGKAHIDGRIQASFSMEPENAVIPRIHRLTRTLKPTWAERFCFYLAVMGDCNRKYERIYGYIQDNVGARQPTLGLGLSLYYSGEEGEGEWIKEDSPLWRYLLKSAVPGEGESRLSRPLVVRDEIYRYLMGEDWLEGAFKRIVSLTEAGDTGRKGRSLSVSFQGLLELWEHQGQENKTKESALELVSTLALIGKMEGADINFSGTVTAENHKAGRQLLGAMEQAGINAVNINVLGPCASRVASVYGWEDLILEDSQKELMGQICSQIMYREQVESWGFYRKSAYGNGVSAVFYGAPGTGKTMAAQVMGRELSMDTYKIDLSQLISKYIGETEKNLNQLFERAGENRAILFFDEADALFARRSSVESSNDRYANMETGYLLQKFEEYDGIVILATNFINNIDDAFKRRIKFFVRFTFPDRNIRLKLWMSMIPDDARLDEHLLLDYYASRFELSGSDIKSVVTGSAYIAASQGRGIKNEDIQKALQIHYLKLGRKLGNSDFL